VDILLNNTLGWDQCCGSGIRFFFYPWIRDGKKIWIRDEHPESYLRKLRKEVKILKFFNADPDPGARMENFGSRVRNKHPGSATLDGTIDK
jgi:hypothetical protein